MIEPLSGVSLAIRQWTSIDAQTGLRAVACRVSARVMVDERVMLVLRSIVLYDTRPHPYPSPPGQESPMQDGSRFRTLVQVCNTPMSRMFVLPWGTPTHMPVHRSAAIRRAENVLN